MDWQLISVIVIIVLAGAYIARSFYRKGTRPGDCDCGCSSCNASDTCSDAPEDP